MSAQPNELEMDQVAVIGMAGRFPRAESLAAFWQNLCAGVESITAWSAEELLAAGVAPEFLADPTYVRAQAMLDGFDQFDAPFFGFSPREAEITNPQHRLFLETCWQALEDAGIDPATFPGTVGVFASGSSNTYILDLFAQPELIRNLGGLRVQIANEKEFLPAWVSYKLDLKGPSVNVQSACSSSLVAVHLACQSLLNGECDVALAGGVSVRALERRGYFYQEGNILSADGHCRAFDAAAGGTVDGDGAGVVVLRRLVDARESGDNLHAVILGSAVNNDGAAKVGFTAPSEEGQTRVISEALSIAGIDAGTLGYVEAHGTGTRLGDPIEAAALAAALRARTGRRGFCALGSVKTNLGHLDAGAGIAGLLKTALSLEHGQLPPSLNFSAPNPEIDFSDSPIYVNATLKTWPQSSTPRRAGVSSFGIGGTNAHAILEEAPEVPSGPSREQQLLVWSAKTEEAADAATGNLERALTSSGAPSLADAAFTLATGRRAFEHRRALVCRQGFDAKRVLADQAPPGRRPVAFLIPGQGSQRPGATGGIYAAEKVFRAEVDRCAKILLPHLGSDLREVLYPQGGDQENAERRLQETAWAQPAVFVTGYALARLWMSWGVQPQALLGHSLGEYVAACLAGVLPLDEALALVALRGRLMGGLSPGGMLAVPLGEAEAAALLPPDLSLAAVNGPQRTVLSGPLPAIEDLERRLAARGLEGRRLRTSHAFHSAMLEPVLPAFAERLRAIPFQAPRIPYLSNVTGDWITAEQAVDPTFWLRQLREPVRFGDAAGRLLEEGNRALLEVGAGRALAGLARQHPLFRPEHRVVSSLASAPDADSTSESAEILEALGRLWASGVAVDWPAYYRGEQRRRVSLPSYPFERRRYFVDRPAGAAAPWTELAIRQQQLVQDNDLNDLEMGSMNRDVEEAPSPARLALVGMLKEIIRDLTGVDAAGLDPEAAFLDIGVDSLLMVQAAQRVRDRLGVKLSVVQLLEELTTLDKVAGYLEAELPAEALAGLAPRALTPQPPLPSPPQPPGEGAPPDADLTATASAPGVETRGYAPAPTRGAAPSPPAAGGGNAPEGHRHVAQGFNPGLGEGASDLTQLFAQQLQVLSQVMAQQNQILLGAPAAPAPQAHPAPPPPPPAVQSPAPTPSAPPTPSAWTPIAVFHPIDRRPPEELSPQQKEYLDQFIARYTARTAKSKQLSATYRPVLADGRFTVSFRRMWKEIVYPIHSQRSKGSRIWDVDGNEYVDISMGFGLHFFGHSPEFLNDALERQLRRGIEVGPQLAQTGRAAEMLCALTGMDRAMFCATGTEAVLGALRVARTVTGRSKIVIFTDSYHGWSDATMVRRPGLRTVPGAPGISPRAIEEVIVLDYGTEDAIEQLAAIGHEIAAVLVEPVRSRFPDVQPREFLHALRRVTEQTGALLIFDEIVTGFRIHPGGAQEHFGVRADLATYGKMISAGLPIGAVAGRAAYMDALDGGTWRFGDDSYPMAEKTLFTGSYFKHPLTMAAACAVLEHLQREGPALQEQLNARTARLTADLNSYFQASGVPIEAVSFASLFRFRPAREMQLPELFYFHLVDHGIYYTQESGNCFLTTAHTDEDVLRIRRAVAQSVEDLAAGGFLPGAHPVPMPAMPELRETKLAADRLTLTTIGIRSRVNQAPEEQIRRMPFSVPLRRGVDFSLSYFGPYEARFEPAKYDLLLTGARFADEHGFTAVWLPERHFHPFGGFSPNPSVLAAALARETKHLQLRAGSTVVPLHHPIRLAEEWSVVDNLSGGRAGVSFASGWHANDFVFAPAAFESRHEAMFEGIEKIRSLWRGEPLHVRDGLGTELDVLLHPLPKQREIPIWLTGSSPAIFAKAGAMGAGILTNLQSQPLDELAEKIGLYYEALVLHGHDPASGRVTLLLHTFVGEDLETARAQAEVPLRAYLRASFDLNRKLVESQGREVDFDAGSESDLDYVLDAAYERFVSEHALVGTPESCAAVIEKLIPLGVTEIGCLIDFGVDPALVAASLPALDRLRQRFAKKDYAELPVTDGQRVLWLASKMSPMANRSYNEPLALRLRGRLNVPHLHAALQTVSDRHQALRSSFSTDGRQKIADPRPEALPLIDYSGLPEPLRSREVLWCLKTWAGEVFDLENGPLLRVCLLRLAAEDHYLSLVAHHIVIDGGSAGVMVRELTSLYAALSAGAPNPLGPPGSFAEYVLRVCSRSPEAPDQLAAEAFWREVFARPVSLLELPLDRPRPRTLQFWGDRPQYQMEPELMRGLRQLAAREKSTPYAVVLAAFGALLQHLTRHDDIIVGVPSRDPSVTGAMVGYFINLLPVRMQRLTGDTFSTLQARVKRELLGVLEHQNFPLNRLLEKLGLAGGLDGFLIGCTFNVERLEEPQPMVGVECEYAWIYHDAARIDLHVNLAEEARSGGAQVDFAFKTTTYDRASVERWAGAFFAVLRQIVGDSAARLDALSLLSPAERQQLIVEHNDTQDGAALAVIAAGACLHTLVEEQAARRPAAPAVALGSEGLSYGDLNRLADHLAGKLKKLGVGPEVKVGLCLDRSLELIVSLLAILKAGGAYVPLEPGQPRDRLVFFLEDAKIPLLLARRAVIDKLGDGLGTGTRALDMDVAFHEVWSAGTAPSPVSTTPATTPDPDHLAYVIYTSGSTGTPNGVPVSHRAAVNLVRQMAALYGVGPHSRIPLVAALSFDVSVFEMFTALGFGGCLCLIRDEERANPFLLADRLASYGVTTAFFTPTTLSVLPEPPLAGVPLLGVGGEASPNDLVERWSRGRRLLNCYGPTEATVFATVGAFADQGPLAKSPPIGRPIGNLEVHLVDPVLRPVPLGVTGEIAIGGTGVARGYLGRPQKTAQRFVPDPFAALRGEAGARLYLTGDLARRQHDGRIEYLGRADGQIKLRGVRIELGEIESLLRAQPGVLDVAVDVRGDKTNQVLAAAVVWEEDWPEKNIDLLQKALEARLPEAMIPATWVELKALPRTANGKLDRLALRAMQDERTRREHVEPETALERFLVDLFREVLHVDRVGLHNNFLELGGNSINGAMLAFHLQESLGEDIHAIIIFDAPTVAELAHFLAVRFPDKVMEAWGEESLPESVRQAILEMVAGMDEEELKSQEGEPTVTGVGA